MFRIGDRDPATGMYWVIGPDGAIAGLGRKLFDEKVQAGDKVTAKPRSDGTWLLLGRDGGATALTNRRRDRAVEAIERESAPKRAKPEYRKLDVFNRSEKEGGDWDLMRVSCTAQNWVYLGVDPVNFQGVYDPPATAVPARLAVSVAGITGTIEYPGIGTQPMPFLYSGGTPIAYAYGEIEPTLPWLFAPTTGSAFDRNTRGPWGHAWNRVIFVVDLRACRVAGIGVNTQNPIEITAAYSIVAGDEQYHPITYTIEPGFYANQYYTNPTTIGQHRLIWRVHLERRKSTNLLRIPAARTNQCCYPAPGSNVPALSWRSGTPAKFGKFPQAGIINHQRYTTQLQNYLNSLVWSLPGYTESPSPPPPVFAPQERAKLSISYPRADYYDHWVPNLGYFVPGKRSALIKCTGSPIPENFVEWPDTPFATGTYVADEVWRSIPTPKPRTKSSAPPDNLLLQQNYREYALQNSVLFQHYFVAE
jgi:hypothetical protein